MACGARRGSGCSGRAPGRRLRRDGSRQPVGELGAAALEQRRAAPAGSRWRQNASFSGEGALVVAGVVGGEEREELLLAAGVIR